MPGEGRSGLVEGEDNQCSNLVLGTPAERLVELDTDVVRLVERDVLDAERVELVERYELLVERVVRDA